MPDTELAQLHPPLLAQLACSLAQLLQNYLVEIDLERRNLPTLRGAVAGCHGGGPALVRRPISGTNQNWALLLVILLAGFLQ